MDRDDCDALNTLATSRRTSTRRLRELSASHYKSVRDHAQFALLTREMSRASTDAVLSCLKRRRGMARSALEGYLAEAPRTSRGLLSFLAKRTL
jgi:hypothetical protein